MAEKVITSGDSDLSLITSKIRHLAPLPREEEADLIIMAQLGCEKSMEKLVLHNLKFVLSVAKGYQNKGQLLNDLIHEGAMGLMEGIRRFSGEKDTKLITYAVWWIRKYIIESFVKSRIVKIAPNKITFLNRVLNCEIQLEGELNRMPTIDELEERLNEPVDKKQLEQIRNGAEKHEYIYSEACEENFNICGDDEESLSKNIDLTIIKSELNKLNEKDQEIIKSSFGFDGLTVQMAADKYGLSIADFKKEVDRVLSKLRRNLKIN